MQCYSLIHKELMQGLQLTDGNHVFFGANGESCKGFKLFIDEQNPPLIKDGVVHEAFCVIDQMSEKPKLIKADRNSSTVLLRILTIADTGRKVSRVKGKWFQTGHKQEAVCTGYGFKRSWVDSLITLRSGNSAVVTMEGGGKVVVLNYEGRVLSAEVQHQHFFEHKHYQSKNQMRKEFTHDKKDTIVKEASSVKAPSVEAPSVEAPVVVQ